MSEELAFTSLINQALWDQARWCGTAFGVMAENDEPPFIGLVFKDATAGRQIFTDWLHRFGSTDENDEIRISIVEGDIEGKETGYSVVVGSDIKGIIDRAKEDGQFARYLATVTRSHRMTPRANSPHMPRFKNAYPAHNEYFLLPVLDDEPIFDLQITKKKIAFRNVADVGPTDLDACIFR